MLRGFEKEDHADLYAKYRPHCPIEVVNKIVEYAQGTKADGKLAHMVDVGCGSGQSTLLFASYIKKITALDISSSQIEQAKKEKRPENIDFVVGCAESLPVDDNSVDLLCSGQAIHWVDFPRFWAECRRVLKPDGSMALYGYDMPHVVPVDCEQTGIDFKNEARQLTMELVKSCKFHERIDHVNNKYVDIFEIIPSRDKSRDDSMKITRHLTLSGYGKYLSTWSGYQTYLRERAPDDKSPDIVRNYLDKLKILYGRENSDDSDVNVVVTYDVFILFAKRPE